MEMVLILLWGLFNTSMAFIAYKKVKSDTRVLSFIYGWGFISGAFVWEDMFVFGLLQGIGAILAFALGGAKFWLLFFLVFWAVRSAGETLYFFLQQFIEPKHHPHYIDTQFQTLRSVLGDISEQKCFIILQVSMQSILVMSVFSLILLLKNW